MKILNQRVKLLILFVILSILSIAVIIVKGNTYEYKSSTLFNTDNIDEISIEIDDSSIVELVDKKIENEVVKLKFASVNTGKTYVTAHNTNTGRGEMFSLYVHKFGVISFNEYMGYTSGCKIIPISISIFFLYITYLLISSYRKSVKGNMYQYKNIAYLGMIVFIVFVTLSQVSTFFNYHGIVTTISQISNMFSFSMVIFPIAFVVSILVIISNILLVKKEGFNIRNILGIVLGVFLCFMTILPEIMYRLLYSASWIDVHNQNGVGLYIYEFVESLIRIVIAYIECVLIGTIIMGIKAAKTVPSFDKDGIIILGCKIKKDGTPTNLLKGRIDRAIEFSKMQKKETGKDIIFIPSGGKGSDEVISEAASMKNYLLDKGISEKDIIVDDKSKNTFENIKFSNGLIKEKIKDAKIAFSTTNYHVFRAGCIATSQSLNLEGIGAKTKSYFWVNAFIREFIATLFNEKKNHLLVVFSITVFSALMIIIMYMNNNI